MAVIRLPQQYTANRQAEAVREAMMSVGEESILLVMYHPAIDQGTHPRCPRCYDADYAEDSDYQCPVCFGTTFNGGIKKMGRVWSIISDNTAQAELLRRFGEFEEDDRMIQIEAVNEVHQHDFVIRVQQWSSDHRVLVPGELLEVAQAPAPHSLRTGNRFGQSTADVTGFSTKGSLQRQFHPLHNLTFPGPIPRFNSLVVTP